MNADLLQGFYLNEILIEPLTGKVTVRSDIRHLPPKAMEVLVCLAQAPGELVTRETLIEKVWGPGLGSHETLSHAVSEIRHALDDHADDPAFIQTLPKRGYRLVVAPELATDTSVVLGTRGGDDLGLIANLKQRGVFETGLAYLVLGWLIIQVADIVFDQLHLPEWTGTFVTLLVIAGFPIALVLSWFLEFRDGRARLDDTSVVATRRRRFSRTYKAVVGALAAAAVLVSLYAQVYELPTAPEPRPVVPEIPSEELSVADNTIAVLPFLNIDGSEESQIFANGFVDDVINRLARVPGLLVSARGDVYTLEPNSPSQAIRRRLRVARYLEGSIQINGERIRIIVQLIDSATGFHILSRTFDRPREDFFDIRDEVTQLTVSSLRPALPAETRGALITAPTRPDLDAYMLYRRGMEESYKPATPATSAAALHWFDEALGVDPDYAAAHAGRCKVLVASFEHTDSPASIDEAEAACAWALDLNPNLDIVHVALGQLNRKNGRYDEAVSSYEAALGINERNVAAWTGLGDTYRLQNRPSEAESAIRRAIDLQPGNWVPNNQLGILFYRQGRYAEAAEQFARVVEIDGRNFRGLGNLATAYMLAGEFAKAAPVFEQSIAIEPEASTWTNLGLMHYYLGKYDAAIAAMWNAVELEPDDRLVHSNLGDVLWIAGERDQARLSYERAHKLVESSLSVNPDDPEAHMDLAWILAKLGAIDKALEEIDFATALAPDDPYGDFIHALIQNLAGNGDKAMAALEAAADKGYSATLIAAEPHLADLRKEPRFQRLISREK